MKRKAPKTAKSDGRRRPTSSYPDVPRPTSPAWRKYTPLAGLRPLPERVSSVPVVYRLKSKIERFPTAVGLLRRNPPQFQNIKNEKRFRENLTRTIAQYTHTREKNTVCRKRHERRRQLFRTGIAGRNKRKSPGQNGTYLRTNESEQTCRRSK